MNGIRRLLPAAAYLSMLSCWMMAGTIVPADGYLARHSVRGFGKVRRKRTAVVPSVLWLSPWGGYNKPRDIRVSHAKEYGFETVDGKFALSGPRYFKNFNEQIASLIKNEHHLPSNWTAWAMPTHILR